MAGATVVGGGFLIEKVNDAGRAFMSGYQIPLESLGTRTARLSGSQRTCGSSERCSDRSARQAMVEIEDDRIIIVEVGPPH
eukprot:107087-Prymnesium_polylepis.1